MRALSRQRPSIVQAPPCSLRHSTSGWPSSSNRTTTPIRISDAYSVVGVPEASVEHVIEKMSSTTLRGKRARVRRYTD